MTTSVHPAEASANPCEGSAEDLLETLEVEGELVFPYRDAIHAQAIWEGVAAVLSGIVLWKSFIQQTIWILVPAAVCTFLMPLLVAYQFMSQVRISRTHVTLDQGMGWLRRSRSIPVSEIAYFTPEKSSSMLTKHVVPPGRLHLRDGNSIAFTPQRFGNYANLFTALCALFPDTRPASALRVYPHDRVVLKTSSVFVVLAALPLLYIGFNLHNPFFWFFSAIVSIFLFRIVRLRRMELRENEIRIIPIDPIRKPTVIKTEDIASYTSKVINTTMTPDFQPATKAIRGTLTLVDGSTVRLRATATHNFELLNNQLVTRFGSKEQTQGEIQWANS